MTVGQQLESWQRRSLSLIPIIQMAAKHSFGCNWERGEGGNGEEKEEEESGGGKKQISSLNLSFETFLII